MPPQKATDGFVQAGDVPNVVRQLRKLASDYDSAAYVIESTFDQPAAEAAAVLARPALREAAARVYSLLSTLEVKKAP